jgi:hypothetical protein
MKEERAEDRKFQRILDDTALLTARSDILSALLALVREWNIAGRPKPSRPHPSFPRWAEIIGGIVEFAGYGCPLEAAEIESAADTDGADMRQLVKLLSVRLEAKFDDLVCMARENGLFERFIDDELVLKPSVKSAFGKLLKKYDHRLFDGCNRFIVDGRGHSRSFRVVSESENTHGQHGQHGVLAD